MPVIREADIRRMQLMYAACYVGDLKGIMVLLNEKSHDVDGNNKLGIDIDPEGHGRRPIHVATITGKFDVVKFLIDNGANVNIQTNYGDTALHFAVYHTRMRFLKLLLESNANPTIQNNIQKTPIAVAKEQHALEFVQEMEKYLPNFVQKNEGKAIRRLLEGK